MKYPTPVLCALLAFVAACGAAPQPSPEPVAAIEAEPEADTGSEDVEAVAATADATAQDPTPASAAPRRRRTGLTDHELAIWNDPTFRKRFVESYVAETEIEPSVTIDEREAMLEVMDLISKDQLEDAAEVLRDNLDSTSSAVFDFTLANIYFQQERLDEAARAYRSAVDKHPKFRRAWGNLGQIRFRQGKFGDTVEAMTRVVELGGGNAVTYGLLGIAHVKQDHAIAAESAFRQAMMLDPGSVDWKMGLAETFFKQQRYADAIALFDALIAEYPDRPNFWLAQGEAYARIDQPMRAAENFEVVDRLGGSSVDSLNNLGDIYANQQLFDLAVDAYLRAIDKQTPGKVPQRAIRAAKFMAANGALDESQTLADGIESALGEDIDNEVRKDLLTLRARLAVARGESGEEARVLEQIVDIDPLDGDALILLGQFYARTGDPERAVFYYERAESLDDFEADAKVRHAQLLVGQGNYAAALPLLRRAQSLQPRDHIQEYLEQVERVSANR